MTDDEKRALRKARSEAETAYLLARPEDPGADDLRAKYLELDRKCREAFGGVIPK